MPVAAITLKSAKLERLHQYVKVSGVTLDRCVDEALGKWLDSVADARLIYLRKKRETQRA
jgi:hypothetical protein